VVALALQVFADEGLEFLADHRALGLPKDEALADLIVQAKSRAVCPGAMVSLLGFFELLEMRVKVLCDKTGRAIDALHLVALFVAFHRRRDGEY